MPADYKSQFVHCFRGSSPYIHAHRGKTFVLQFTGEAVADQNFTDLIHDVALLSSLGIRLVLVHGIRPQVESRLAQLGVQAHYAEDLRVTDDTALACVKEAAGTVRVEIEALLSMSLANSPMAGARLRVTSGNFVTAKPMGVRDGTDFQHTGEVRRIDAQAINQQLNDGTIVLLSPLGYSPTGETFNLFAEDVATATASALHANKLIFLTEDTGRIQSTATLAHEFTPDEIDQLISSNEALSSSQQRCLSNAAKSCRSGVSRAHIVSRTQDGALLLELFTRDGIGTMVTEQPYENTRAAQIDDIVGILELISPLEQEGILTQRSREKLEMEINHFVVVERDGTIIGCAAMYPFVDEKIGELACVAIHPDYRNTGRGDTLLATIERHAQFIGLHKLFVLTTRTAHWFIERGYETAALNNLPIKRQALYNYKRNSKVFIKTL